MTEIRDWGSGYQDGTEFHLFLACPLIYGVCVVRVG